MSGAAATARRSSSTLKIHELRPDQEVHTKSDGEAGSSLGLSPASQRVAAALAHLAAARVGPATPKFVSASRSNRRSASIARRCCSTQGWMRSSRGESCCRRTSTRRAGTGVNFVDMSLDALAARAAQLAQLRTRAVLGIVGSPGAGKSTLAEALVQRLGHRAALVPLDGFHLDDAVLEVLGRRDRKGAPDTFDACGYVALLRRLHERTDDVVYAPIFRREDELAVAGARPVPRDVPLVVTEGNYLLADGEFGDVRPLLTESWFVHLDPKIRRGRLIARHVAHGRTEEEAEHWVAGSDDRNADLVDSTRTRADLVLRVTP